MQVNLISITHPFGIEVLHDETTSSHPEELIAYCARVSNPENQNNITLL